MASVHLRFGNPVATVASRDPLCREQKKKSQPTCFQIRSEAIREKPPLILTLRRDAMISMTTSLATVLFPRLAEARQVKPEIRKKIREKLDKLREKAGLPKEKRDSSSEGAEKTPSQIQNNSIGPLVEATVAN